MFTVDTDFSPGWTRGPAGLESVKVRAVECIVCPVSPACEEFYPPAPSRALGINNCEFSFRQKLPAAAW